MPYRLRQSGELRGDLLKAFAIGTAVLGLILFLAWPATQQLHNRGPHPSSTVVHNLIIGVASYEYETGQLPAAVTQSTDNPPSDLHGWHTLLLPYVEQQPLYESVNLTRPWDDPVNRDLFRTPVEAFKNPVIEEEADSSGLAIAHHSANSHVFVTDRSPLRIAEITDGLSNTLGVGEIVESFPPWGRPRNVRDPTLGINTAPNGFGGPRDYKGALISTLDGKVNFISPDIDPDVLRAISTPAGGENATLP